MFDPIQPSSRSARDFLAMLKGPKVRSRFPDVSLEEVIREDRGWVGASLARTCSACLLARPLPTTARLMDLIAGRAP